MSTIRIKPIGRRRQYKDFDDFCRIPNMLSKIMGYDLGNPYRPIILKWLIRIYTIAVVLSQFYCFFYITKEVYLMMMLGVPDLSLFLRLLSGFNYAFFATVKFMFCTWNLKGSHGIYTSLKELYPKTVSECRLYNVNEYFWPRWIQTILYFYGGAVTFIVISPFWEGIIFYTIDMFRVGFGEAKFGYFKLYEILYGFDHHNPLAYIVTYCIEIMHAQFVIIFNISADIWLLCYTLQVCMHFDYVARTLEQYEPDERTPVKDNRFLAEVVKKHQILLELSKTLNDTFGSLLMLLLMSTAATLCCAGVYTLTQGVGREFLEYVAFLPTAIGQYFLICYYGQHLIETSQNIANAAYNHAWYNGSQSYKKSILIIIIRSQKEVELNANGYKTICLESFKMVMGETYRIFALLKQTMLE